MTGQSMENETVTNTADVDARPISRLASILKMADDWVKVAIASSVVATIGAGGLVASTLVGSPGGVVVGVASTALASGLAINSYIQYKKVLGKLTR